MAKNKISEFDVNPDNNTDINNINIAEGCAPSGINNAIRQLMSDLKEQLTGASGDPFTVGGAFAANGGATLGDASGDALTINSSAVSIPNGLNFDSNTFVIDATNNRVGIGTSSPTQKLQITGSSVSLKLEDTSGAAYNITSLTASGAASTISWDADNVVSGSYLSFVGDGSEKMRIDSSGNVGIGTSSPNIASGFTNLVVSDTDNGGIIYVDRTSGARGYFYANGTTSVNLGTVGSYPLVFSTADTERMRIDSSGNVGIGTSSPTSKLHINGSGLQQLTIQSTTTNPVLFFATASGQHPYLQWQSAGGSAMKFYDATAGLDRLIIDSSGNLLVGTTTASNSCRAVIKGGNGTQLTLDNAGETYTQLYFNNNGSAKADLYFENTTTRLYVRSNNSGGVYLGSGGTSWTSASDERIKDIIEPIDNANEKIANWRTVVGKYKTDQEGTRKSFLIAQDVLATFPEAVDTTKEDEYGVRYQDIIPLLVAAIKEQQAIITDLKARIETLEGK